jgi:hypothetical protein
MLLVGRSRVTQGLLCGYLRHLDRDVARVESVQIACHEGSLRLTNTDKDPGVRDPPTASALLYRVRSKRHVNPLARRYAQLSRRVDPDGTSTRGPLPAGKSLGSQLRPRRA